MLASRHTFFVTPHAVLSIFAQLLATCPNIGHVHITPADLGAEVQPYSTGPIIRNAYFGRGSRPYCGECHDQYFVQDYFLLAPALNSNIYICPPFLSEPVATPLQRCNALTVHVRICHFVSSTLTNSISCEAIALSPRLIKISNTRKRTFPAQLFSRVGRSGPTRSLVQTFPPSGPSSLPESWF